MNASDVPGVARAHVAAWQKAFRGILSDKLLDSLSVERSEAVWRELLQREGRTHLVAEQGDVILGYVAFGPAQAPDASALPVGEIIGLYVHPDHWRMGAGRRLLQQAIEALRGRGVPRVFVWTMAENALAKAFYQKNGFIADGRERTSQRQGESFREVRFFRPL
jgi:ribosomal protein S18 acetylase RimI-like enzyme